MQQSAGKLISVRQCKKYLGCGPDSFAWRCTAARASIGRIAWEMNTCRYSSYRDDRENLRPLLTHQGITEAALLHRCFLCFFPMQSLEFRIRPYGWIDMKALYHSNNEDGFFRPSGQLATLETPSECNACSSDNPSASIRGSQPLNQCDHIRSHAHDALLSNTSSRVPAMLDLRISNIQMAAIACRSLESCLAGF